MRATMRIARPGVRPDDLGDHFGEADELQASAIVLGSRGLTGIRSLLLGSVSQAIVHHADRAVIIVPSREVAAERAKRRR